MANKYFRKWTTLLTITEMQIKTTLKFCLALVRMAVIKRGKKSGGNKHWQECGERTHDGCSLLLPVSTGTATVENQSINYLKSKNRIALLFISITTE